MFEDYEDEELDEIIDRITLQKKEDKNGKITYTRTNKKSI
jgi:hypothetical protein